MSACWRACRNWKDFTESTVSWIHPIASVFEILASFLNLRKIDRTEQSKKRKEKCRIYQAQCWQRQQTVIGQYNNLWLRRTNFMPTWHLVFLFNFIQVHKLTNQNTQHIHNLFFTINDIFNWKWRVWLILLKTIKSIIEGSCL